MKEAFEKIIERLEEMRDKYENLVDSSNFDGYHEEEIKYLAMQEAYEHAIEIVNQVAEEYSHVSTCYLQSPCEYQTKDIIVDVNSGWIPCSERFPESYVDVLVTVRNFEYPQIGHLECGIWYADDDVRFLQDAVIAWQPLPKPYELERRATNEN